MKRQTKNSTSTATVVTVLPSQGCSLGCTVCNGGETDNRKRAAKHTAASQVHAVPQPWRRLWPRVAHDSAPNACRGTPSANCERLLTAARVCGAAAQSPSNEYNLVAQAAEPFYVTDVGLAMLTMLPTMPTILTEPTMLTVPTVPTILTMPTVLTVQTMLTMLTKKASKQDVIPETPLGAGIMRQHLF